MLSVSDKLYTAAASRALDRCAIEEHGIDGYTLMCRAGNAVVEAARGAWPSRNSWLVLCGAGNNGGDGYVIARLAHDFGVKVRVLALSDPDRLQGDAARAFAAWRDSGGETGRWPEEIPDQVNLVIDAMLGTGLDRAVDGDYADAIERVNALDEVRVAVDIPSGLNADTGAIMGCAVRADLTVTFIGKKRGLFTGDGPDVRGKLVFDRLGVPAAVYAAVADAGRLLGRDTLARQLRKRPRNSHKGSFGHVLLVGGAPGMSGAVRLAGEGALRAGAGLVSIATHPDHALMLNLTRPELMVQSVGATDDTAGDLATAARRATVIAVGPGLGTSEWSQALFEACLADERPLIVDADGLNLLAQAPRQRADWVLTPHPAEAGRLLGTDAAAVQADRVGSALELARRYQAVVVLKGSGTIVVDPEGRWEICALGNPGMATGGAGDVLTGVIAAFRAQGFAAFDAARLGVLAHAAAGDVAAREGERGLLALDIARQLQGVVNPA